MLRRFPHHLEHLLHKRQRHPSVEEVRLRVHEYDSRIAPASGDVKSVFVDGDPEAGAGGSRVAVGLVLGRAHGLQTLRHREVVAAPGDAIAPGGGIPRRLCPLHGSVVRHQITSPEGYLVERSFGGPLPGCGRSVSLGRPWSLPARWRWWRGLTVRCRELAAIVPVIVDVGLAGPRWIGHVVGQRAMVVGAMGCATMVNASSPSAVRMWVACRTMRRAWDRQVRFAS